MFSRKEYIRSIQNFPLQNGITNRLIGDFSLHQDPEETENQLRRLSKILSINELHRLIPQHGSEVSYAERILRFTYYNSDALIAKKGENPKLLTSPTGDCPIVMVTNKQTEFGALIHAGWRPIKGNIIPATIAHLKEMSPPEQLEVGIFPGICKNCFKVEPGFDGEGYFDNYIDNDHLNLKEVILEQLINWEKIPADNIHALKYCSCHERITFKGVHFYLFFSYRRDKRAERNLVFLSI